MGKRRRKRFSVGVDNKGNQYLKPPLETLDEMTYKKAILSNIGVPFNVETVDDDLSSFLPTFYPKTPPPSCVGTYYLPSSPLCQQCAIKRKCLSSMVNKSNLWGGKYSLIKKKIVFKDRFEEKEKSKYLEVLELFDSSQKFKIKQGLIISGEGLVEKVSKKILKSYVFSVKAKDITKCVKEVIDVELPFSEVIATTMFVIDRLMGNVFEEA